MPSAGSSSAAQGGSRPAEWSAAAISGRTVRVRRTHAAYQAGAHSTRGRTALVTVEAAWAAYDLSSSAGADPRLAAQLAPSSATEAIHDDIRRLTAARGRRDVVRALGRLARPDGGALHLPVDAEALAEYALVCSERFRDEVDRTKSFGKREKARLRAAARRRLRSDLSGFELLAKAAAGGPDVPLFAAAASLALLG